MKTPKDINDPTFSKDDIGFCLKTEMLYALDKGTVYVPNTGDLKYIPLSRKTRLELILVDDPEAEFIKYCKFFTETTPKVNDKRLEFIQKRREEVEYQDLGVHPLALIGEDGLGCEWNDGWVEFPQTGGIEIGKNVRIGAFTSVKKGTIDNTIIEDGCKIGSHCNIAHNVKLGKDCLLTHRVSIGGSVEVGERVYFGQGCIIKNKLTIGDGAVIGQGANVLKDVPPNAVMIGNPAKQVK